MQNFGASEELNTGKVQIPIFYKQTNRSIALTSNCTLRYPSNQPNDVMVKNGKINFSRI